MRVTGRDRQVLLRLAAARWLTTHQIAALCFPKVSTEMARRRLRLLREESYIHSHQSNRMAEALHSVGVRGKALLVKRGWERCIRLERRTPRNLEHFLGINDLRVAVQQHAMSKQVRLKFFFACWELQAQGWKHSTIPDAVCCLEQGGDSQTVLFEFDRGEEAPGFVLRTKFAAYARGLDGFAFSRVIVVVQTQQRLQQLQKYASVASHPERFRFCLTGDLDQSLNLG